MRAICGVAAKSARNLGRHTSASLLSWRSMSSGGLLLLSACNGGPDSETPSPTPTVQETIFHGDMVYESIDGSAYYARGVHAFRIDPNGGDSGCLMLGVSTSECHYDGVPEHLHMKSSSVQNFSTYVRERIYEVQGISSAGEEGIHVIFTMQYLYTYSDGGTATRTYTGTGTLSPVQQFEEEEAKGLRLLGEYGDFSSPAARYAPQHVEMPGEEQTEGKFASASHFSVNVRVHGDYAYLVRLGDGLRILNIAEPEHIFEVAHLDPDDVGAWYYNDVKLMEQGGRLYALVADSTIGMLVYDVTQPESSFLVSTFFPGLADSEDGLNNHTLAVVGTTAYMANYEGSITLDPEGYGESGGLIMVDLSTPSAPQELGRWLTREVGGTFTHDLFVKDSRAYLASWEAGLVVLDVAKPTEPSIVGRFTYDRMTSHSVWVAEVGGRLVAAHGDEDYYSHLRIVDVDPNSSDYMQEIGSLMLRPQVSIHNVMIQGEEVIAAHYQDGVRIFDISDPTKPALTAWFNTWQSVLSAENGKSFYEGACGVDVVGNRIYVADISRGLLILERSP